MFNKKNRKNDFLYKKSYLNKRLQQEVLENGVAYIPCRVDSINDIISKFSVKDCESLDSEFMLYITDFIEYVPKEYPVVLEIEGPEFSDEEKRIITDAVTADMDYFLGKTEEYIAKKRKMFLIMILGTIISGIVLGIAKEVIKDVPLEFFYVLFWLFADSLVRYLFIEKMDFTDSKIRVGRLASIKVEFKEKTDDDKR